MTDKGLISASSRALMPKPDPQNPAPSFGFGPGARASTYPLIAGGVLHENKWETLPKGWDDESRDKYAKSMSHEKEGAVSTCIDKISGHVDDPGAFCAALHDQVTGTTDWRGKKEGGPGSGPHEGTNSYRGARVYKDGKHYRAITPTGHNIGPFKSSDLLKSHLDKNDSSFGLAGTTHKQADSGTTHVAQTRPTKTFESKHGKHHFKEASSDGFKNHRFEVELIKEGLGNFNDCFFYTKESLQKAAASKLFEGVQAFANHPSSVEEEILPERSVRDIIGYYENVQYKENDQGQGTLIADLNVSDNVSLEWALSLLTNTIEYSKKFKEKDFVGLSINASGSASPVGIDDFIKSQDFSAPVLQKLQEAQAKGITEINVVGALTESESVDMVTKAGAGGRIIQMLEQEKSMFKKAAALKESEKKEMEKKEAGEGGMPAKADGASDGDAGGATPDHADADQDKALFAQMIKKYLGKGDDEQATPEEMEVAKHAYEAAKEGGMEHEAAMEAAGQHLKMAMAIGKKMAQAEAKKHEHESHHESHEKHEHEAESHKEGQTPPPHPKSTEGHKEAAAIAKLTGENARLRESLKKFELDKYFDKKMAESKQPNPTTKAFRDMFEKTVGAPKSKEQIDQMWTMFITAKEAARSEEVSESPFAGMFGEKTVRESESAPRKSASSFADCVRE